jgi:hypothetical protein
MPKLKIMMNKLRIQTLGLLVLGIVLAIATILGTATSSQAACDPSYPTVCISPPPPDLDCKDIQARNFRVIGNDPHHFDGDHDHIGCEQHS